MVYFKNILSSGREDKRAQRIRFFLVPMGSNLKVEDGFCGRKIRKYYPVGVKGGAVLLTMGRVPLGFPEGTSIGARKLSSALNTLQV